MSFQFPFLGHLGIMKIMQMLLFVSLCTIPICIYFFQLYFPEAKIHGDTYTLKELRAKLRVYDKRNSTHPDMKAVMDLRNSSGKSIIRTEVDLVCSTDTKPLARSSNSMYQETISKKMWEYYNLKNITSYIPPVSKEQHFNILKTIPEEEKSFRYRIREFEAKFNVSFYTLPSCFRYLLSLRFLSFMGYEKKLPGAIIIGAKKGGTTALRFLLGLHPQIRGWGSELEFFSRDEEYEKGLDYYRSNFTFTKANQITLEKSPYYFPTKDVPQRMWESFGRKIKFILCIRDPVLRTISDFHHTTFVHMKKTEIKGRTKMSEGDRFAKTILDENGKIRTDHTYIKNSVYSLHIKEWLKYFSMDDIFIAHDQDMREDLATLLRRIEAFLNVKRFFEPQMLVYRNKTNCVNLPTKLARLPTKLACPPTWGHELPKPDVNQTVTRIMREYFRPFNEEFEKLTNRSFSWTHL